ncbi:hypothetical protein PbJCM13498_39530 [Prolixibacter bellariivorans]|uniref:Uncharacterized protein n=1 Tax=Prolixibacter bellariivorans TaxID=314319 RepID=A0A5M4B4T8_9BACT|nr:hypothetical protein [Prolixibacter bellariivorans]GET35090.1 hypothetical protein PbJCM13498_39530 [Prolixibacter bellariivorans]
MDKSRYKFEEEMNTACLTCVHVMTKSKPILFVSHDDDSSWEFSCGANGHSEEEIKIISLEEATDIDGSINELASMPEGVCAERESIGAKWMKK